MRTLITAALLAALSLAMVASTAEAGIFRRRDGTARQPVKKTVQAVKAAVGCHCNR